MTDMTDLRARTRHAFSVAGALLRSRGSDSYEDEMAMATEYDRRRGYDRPRRERSKEAHEMAEGAPLIRWTPAARRPHA